MKRIGNLFNKICSIENFKIAYNNATKGKKYYKDVIAIEEYGVDLFLQQLLEEVITHQYAVSEYKVFKMKNGGKIREIYKLPMKDRIVQHAIMNYLEPIFRNSFISDTFASIKGRGIHKCLCRVRKALVDVENTKYCLKLDITKFYPSINKELMKERLKTKFKDEDLLILLNTIVDSSDKGLPIGNYTSQYFANFFLSEFDHWLKEKVRVKYYFRYCDDMVILGPSKEYLWNVFHMIQEKISQLQLTLKPNWQVFPVESRGVDFVGYVSFHTHTKVRKAIKHNFIKNKNSKAIPSYWGLFSYADCKNLWNKYKKW